MKDLAEILNNYGIKGQTQSTTKGPLLEIKEFLPAPGTKLKQITSSLADIQRELGVSSLNVEPHPVNSSLLFEYTSDTMEIIDFTKFLNSKGFEEAKNKYALPLCIGADIYGSPLFADLAKMPHLLVGGTTGSGKSVGLNTFILSLISAKTPSEVQFVLIDPKKIEFSIYNNQKYLYCPVITEANEAISVLSYLAQTMDERYELFSQNLSKNLKEYNSTAKNKLPYIVCLIDEFADLMALDKDVEQDVMRLAQKARAAGINLILATQRPSVDVVTGVLKANFPTRLAYKVASSADSRTILDAQGAENLIGRGDSYFLASNGELSRVHGAFIEDDKIKEILAPYKCTIKPLKLEQKGASLSKNNQEDTSLKKDKPSLLTRFVNFWSKLRQKDRDLIIKGIKYIFTFIVSYIKKSQKSKK